MVPGGELPEPLGPTGWRGGAETRSAGRLDGRCGWVMLVSAAGHGARSPPSEPSASQLLQRYELLAHHDQAAPRQKGEGNVLPRPGRFVYEQANDEPAAGTTSCH